MTPWKHIGPEAGHNSSWSPKQAISLRLTGFLKFGHLCLGSIESLFETEDVFPEVAQLILRSPWGIARISKLAPSSPGPPRKSGGTVPVPPASTPDPSKSIGVSVGPTKPFARLGDSALTQSSSGHRSQSFWTCSISKRHSSTSFI
jgi:hypothetical protein